MEAGKRSINDIFNGNRILKIPFFQRSYVWKELEWERLLNDIEFISENNKPYFLGSVILKQQETNVGEQVGDIRTVIDGQQRLTTLNLFFKAFCLKSNLNSNFNKVFRLMNDSIALEHNHNDKESFDDVLSLKEFEEINSKSNIVKAFNYFHEKIDFFKVLTNIMFVSIELGREEDEQQIFDTINSLGLKLTTAELLKNYLFGRDAINSYEVNWKLIFEKDDETKSYWDKEITTGRVKRNNIDIFLYSFLQIKLQDSNLKVKTEDKNNFSKVEGVFNSYKSFISLYNIDKKDIIDEVKEYAKIYFSNIDFDIVENELTNEFGIERINVLIFGLDNSTLFPYILYVLKNVTDKNELNKIFNYLECYIMRRIICRASNKNYSRLFSEELISNSILSRDHLKEIIENKSDKSNYMPSDEEVESNIKEAVFTNKQASGILYMIESKIRKRNIQATALLGINKYTLEHIMPKKWENHWDKIEKEEDVIYRNKKLLTLGNLTIITGSLNSSIRDSDWLTKREGKKDKKGLTQYSAGIESISNYLSHQIWNEVTIDNRAHYLINKAIEVWKI